MKKTDVVASAEGMSSLLRPFFSPGLLLEDDDLNTSVAYTRNMVRLLFRSLFGCGVICGLKVAAEPACENRKIRITVEKGVALDCAGNPIEVSASQSILYDPGCDKFPDHLWVAVCYAEKPCRPKDVSCSSEEASGVAHTRVRGGFEVKVYKNRPDCACSCEPESENEPENNAECCQSQPSPAPKSSTEVSRGQASALLGPCDCYRKHIEGECECDCGCSCVVIGRIDLAIGGEGAVLISVDSTIRRFIRPVLQGYVDCVRRGEESPPVAAPKGDEAQKAKSGWAGPTSTTPAA